MIRKAVRFVRPPEAPTGWRRMLLLSLVLHLAGFGGAIGLPRLVPRTRPGTPVYVVDLVSLPAPAPIGRRPGGGAAPREKPPAPKPVPQEEKAIKIPDRQQPKPTPKREPPKPEPRKEPPKPEPKKEPPKPEPGKEPEAPAQVEGAATQQEAPPAQETAAGSGQADGGSGGPTSALGGSGTAAIGIPGGTGGMTGDAYTFYFALLRRRIESSWQKPIYPPNYTDRRTLLVTVRLGLSSSGRVTGLDLVAPSGYDALDRSILRAVRDAEPFPPFPPQITRSQMTIPIEFVFKPD